MLSTTGINAFVGINGSTANAMGLSLNGVDFGLALLSDSADSSRSWISMQANVATAIALGIPEVTLTGSAISVEINLTGSDGTLIDYAVETLTVGSISLGVGAEEGEMLRVKGDLNLRLRLLPD